MSRSRPEADPPGAGAPSRARLLRLVRRFGSVRLLVVGDLMLDQFIWGRVSRISPEAPVPVVHVSEESFRLGGAANVVANVRALGGRAAVAGIVGRDAYGRRVVGELRRLGAGTAGVITARDLETTRKTRILAHQQQVVRLDRERPLRDGRLSARIAEHVRKTLAAVDGVVVSDYGKGVITPELLALLAERRGGEPKLFVDPKRGNFEHYRRATLVKPNEEAASAASGIEISDAESLRRAGERLLELWDSAAVLISRGEEGMTLFRPDRAMAHFPAAAREVFDVTGAGDTVLATASLALAAGGTYDEAAVLANRAAGIVVAKVGTAAVGAAELADDVERNPP
ncbi:MAG: D-glycero-beta-D-manno-heptose-7-phosphate kinase [Candidatus Binatota bacterium]|nr:D-glycero-beta-D-manno-heptose-7-phosphate kinase [Candidatus Binatota bacterium]